MLIKHILSKLFAPHDPLIVQSRWIEEHGSEALKNSSESDRTRLYYIERAAVEYPGFIYDHNHTADGVGLEALHPKRQPHQRVVALVWLVTPPTNEPNAVVQRFDVLCQAVGIEDDRYLRPLYKLNTTY